jgi:hypothetical protein
MDPTRFPQANTVLGPPPDMGEGECQALAVHRDGVHCISRWMPTAQEREDIANGEPVWLWVRTGQSQPPVALTTTPPTFTQSVQGNLRATTRPHR